MKLTRDPYMLRHVPLTQLPGAVADLGYEYVELSPRDDCLPFFVHGMAGRAHADGYRAASTVFDTDLPDIRLVSGLPGSDPQARYASWVVN